MSIYESINSLSDANSLVMKARIASQNSGPVLEKLRRISHYIENRIGEELATLQE